MLKSLVGIKSIRQLAVSNNVKLLSLIRFQSNATQQDKTHEENKTVSALYRCSVNNPVILICKTSLINTV